MKIFPTYIAMDGIKEIDLNNNKGIKFGEGICPGVTFTREINIELMLKAELHQMAAQNKMMNFAISRIGRN